MNIIITHKSALEYWRLHSSARIVNAARLDLKDPPASIPSIASICDKMPPELSYPISLLAGSQNTKRKSSIVKLRIHTGKLPGRCFVSIGDGLAVSAPHFCFFQMADELTLIELIGLGFELCGFYSLSVKQDFVPGTGYADNNAYSHPQLTNVRALKRLMARMEGASGYKKASRALRYIADGSASPMETILCILLTLPYHLGGYGLPTPELNRRINLGKADRERRDKSYYVCDLFWPVANLAIEYDSNRYHTGADRIADDSEKRLDLGVNDITVETVTNRQIRNPAEVESLAKYIAKKLGRQLQHNRNPKFAAARRELRRLLL